MRLSSSPSTRASLTVKADVNRAVKSSDGRSAISAIVFNPARRKAVASSSAHSSAATGSARTSVSFSAKHGLVREKRAKARASKIGEDINLYISNDVASGVAQVVHDGEYLNIIITKIDYGEFHLVEYKGERCFALKTNVSELLSLNETLALIIGGAAAAVTVAIIIILIVVKNKKLYKETA